VSDRPRPVVLVVLDGWGLRQDAPDNAITRAPARHMEALWQQYPHTQLQAHGEAVGLIPDQMGDSNVGHLTLGAGRVVYQNLARIHRAVQDGSLLNNPVLTQALDHARGHRLHLFGLLSDGGVHSHQDHLTALLKAAQAAGLTDVFLHVCLDGRDVPPESAFTYLERLAGDLAEVGVGQVATIMGRYYGMDRDKRWDRTEKAYRAMVEGVGPTARSAPEAVSHSYEHQIHDEFVVPTVLVRDDGTPVATIRTEDTVLLFNFRADRMRQMARALWDPDFDQFARPFPRPAFVAGMTLYDENLPLPHLFDPQAVPNNLAAWLALQGLTQLHVAETEKYAHVTFFFNGGVEEPVQGEDRKLVPSPKVATYDETPEMSAEAITDTVLEAIQQDAYDFILLNYANSDMVGHTGIQAAAEAAVRAADAGVGRIADAVRHAHGLLVVTADHGNAEHMEDEHGGPDTNHTSAPVPLIIAGAGELKLRPGGLKDVAPTILSLMGLPIPAEMTGDVLIES
jgi:2,3-bisphosphoglycerate-independent phosphoglycerate mutase